MKILISDKSSPKCAEILRAAGHEVDERDGLAPEELARIIADYDGLVIRSATKVTRELLEAAKNLKIIGRAGTGVDNVDLEAAAERNIVVMNTPGGNSNAVAELALLGMLAISRDYYNAVHSLKSHRWDKKLFKGSEICSKTLGLLGYGRVSRLLGRKCLALGMAVKCFDPKILKDIIDEDGIELVSSLPALLSQSDFVSVHLSKRSNTVDFVAKAQFAEMKKGVFLINLSRGGIVNEADLLSALQEEIVAGAVLDVYGKEPVQDFALVDHPRVICTPHIGAASRESQQNVAVMVAEQIADFFASGEKRNAVVG